MRIAPKTITIFESGANVPDDTICVAISLFNYEKFIEECLDSVAAQTHQNIELLVVDDCSEKDKSKEICLGWITQNFARFKRILFLQHRCNQGLAQARNTAFNNARAEFVFVIDADNKIFPTALSKLLRVANITGAGAVYSQLQIFGDETGVGFGDFWSKHYFEEGNYVDAMALVRKSSWNLVGGYTHIEGGWEDYDFWCKFIEQNIEAVYVPEMLCCYRVHGSSMLRTETNKNYDQIHNIMLMRHPWLRIGNRR